MRSILFLLPLLGMMLAANAFAEEDDDSGNADYDPQTQVRMMHDARQLNRQDDWDNAMTLRSAQTGSYDPSSAPVTAASVRSHGSSHAHASRGSRGGGGGSYSSSASGRTSAPADVTSSPPSLPVPAAGAPTLQVAPPPLQAPSSAVPMPVLPISPGGP